MIYLDQLLNELVQDSTPTDSEMGKALARAERWGQLLQRDKEMCVEGFLAAGSCAKGTACRPINDADVMVQLRPDAFLRADRQRRQPAAILEVFAERLSISCRSLLGVSVRKQTHSVRLVHEGERSFDVDIVPAYPVGDGIVEIPERGTREWVRTSFVRQAELLDRLDVKNRSVRRSIRLLKLWRDQHDVFLPSYALEVLVLLAAFRDVPRHPATLLLESLRLLERESKEALVLGHYWKASPGLRTGVYDPAVPGNNLTRHLYADERRKIASRAARSANALESARRYAENGSLSRAEERVGAAFGLT